MEVIVITGVTSCFGVNWLYELDMSKNAIFFILGRDEEKFKRFLKRKFILGHFHKRVSCLFYGNVLVE